MNCDCGTEKVYNKLKLGIKEDKWDYLVLKNNSYIIPVYNEIQLLNEERYLKNLNSQLITMRMEQIYGGEFRS